MNKHGFTIKGNPSGPGRVIGEDSSVKVPHKTTYNLDSIVFTESQVVLNGIDNVPFELSKQLVYYRNVELYLTAQLQAVKQKIKETEEELNNGNQQ